MCWASDHRSNPALRHRIAQNWGNRMFNVSDCLLSYCYMGLCAAVSTMCLSSDMASKRQNIALNSTGSHSVHIHHNRIRFEGEWEHRINEWMKWFHFWNKHCIDFCWFNIKLTVQTYDHSIDSILNIREIDLLITSGLRFTQNLNSNLKLKTKTSKVYHWIA